ncbi:MAG: hypothetical protein WEA09_03895 [Gemmatimonadota bacterium]
MQSDTLLNAFHATLQKVEDGTPLSRDIHRKQLLSHVDVLTDSQEGQKLLLKAMPRVVAAGIFDGTVWAEPQKLVPTLVGGTLRAGGEATLLEILSELRILGVARGELTYPSFSDQDARAFLEEVVVRDLSLLFPSGTEAERVAGQATNAKISHLAGLLVEVVPLESLKDGIATELELICGQRPIVTDRVLEMVRALEGRLPLDPEGDQRLRLYMDAVMAPSPGAKGRTVAEYGDFLLDADAHTLAEEAQALGTSMRATGLAVGAHALLVRRVASDPKLLALALGLNEQGKAELDTVGELVRSIITQAVHPATARSCYGLARLLERGVLSRQPVRTGLRRIAGMTLHAKVAESIQASRPDSSLSPRDLLLADCVGVLGQPLGVGQGWNPTCQSARGISLWSRHAPGKLLGMIETTARTHEMSMRFEGQEIQAGTVIFDGPASYDLNLDAVSVVLVPHLDRIYNEMLRRAAFRGADPHKWVNPAMYGHWIPQGFISAYDEATGAIRGYDNFLRTFYATHHPAYNGGYDQAYPNPVGIFLTSATGALLGFHAVSILRVREHEGQVRVYFLNPNNEGRQQWQEDIQPTVAGNGEQPGESSLPFHQFAARLYAFHFGSSEVGDLARVAEAEVTRVRDISLASWGKSYTWLD